MYTRAIYARMILQWHTERRELDRETGSGDFKGVVEYSEERMRDERALACAGLSELSEGVSRSD